MYICTVEFFHHFNNKYEKTGNKSVDIMLICVYDVIVDYIPVAC